MPEKVFWKCTLRKLIALKTMHMEVNNKAQDDDEWDGAGRSYW